MDILRKLNSKEGDMVLRIIRSGMREASSVVLLGLAAVIADELGKRCLSKLKSRLRPANN